MGTPTLRLPRVQSVSIRHMSLYAAKDEVALTFDTSAFCVAGANGLGKSTFLNCLLFGLTGIVRDPRRSFSSFEEFVRENESYAKEYFHGRILPPDRELAEIEVTFRLGSGVLSVRRGFFGGSQVTAWNASPEIPGAKPGTDGYHKALETLSGLDDYRQFVFLMHYVLTFDESRQLIFWDSAVLTRALTLLLGWDPKMPAEADKMSRQIERLDSRVRNLQWDISKARTYIRNLQADIDTEDPEVEADAAAWAAKEEHERLQRESDALKEALARGRQQLDFVRATLSELTARQVGVRSEYNKVFESLLTPPRAARLRNHPLIQEILETQHCALCGSDEAHVVETIEKAIASGRCPLCDSDTNTTVSAAPGEELSERLRVLADDLEQTAKREEEVLKERERLVTELHELATQLDTVQYKLTDIEGTPAFERAQKTKASENAAISSLIAAQRARIEFIQKDKEVATKERDRLIKQAEALRQKLEKQWYDAEEQFLPVFRSLAHSFTGLPISIRLNQVKNDRKPELNLILGLQDTERQSEHQLSESQRFFIDIALRMAFIQFASAEADEGALIVDTPEGSLDIAYEHNAGEMFAKFVGLGKQLIMTANINSSGLVRAMARKCGSRSFRLHRMIDWVHLSDVQMKRMDLFEEALSEVDRELRGQSL